MTDTITYYNSQYYTPKLGEKSKYKEIKLELDSNLLFIIRIDRKR